MANFADIVLNTSDNNKNSSTIIMEKIKFFVFPPLERIYELRAIEQARAKIMFYNMIMIIGAFILLSLILGHILNKYHNKKERRRNAWINHLMAASNRQAALLEQVMIAKRRIHFQFLCRCRSLGLLKVNEKTTQTAGDSNTDPMCTCPENIDLNDMGAQTDSDLLDEPPAIAN